MSAAIGLLYDHTHPNFGDRAIGIALEQLLSRHGIPYEIVSNKPPALVDTYPLVIVGGGHCIRAQGDSFYDQFRIPGRHILNAAGVSPECGDVGFLGQYCYVSVRSKADLAFIQATRPDASVVPCISMLMDASAGATSLPPLDGVLLINMNETSGHAIPHWLELARAAFPDLEPVLLSITPYNKDKEYLSTFAQRHGLRLLSGLEPMAVAAVLAADGVHAILSSSLHASLFAYRSAKPFLVFAYDEKIRFFLGDRGLGGRVWTPSMNAPDMRECVGAGPEGGGDLAASWRKDHQRLLAHGARIVQECRRALAHTAR